MASAFQEFSNVLREMMPMIESLYAGNKPTVTESTDADGKAWNDCPLIFIFPINILILQFI